MPLRAAYVTYRVLLCSEQIARGFLWLLLCRPLAFAAEIRKTLARPCRIGSEATIVLNVLQSLAVAMSLRPPCISAPVARSASIFG